MAVFLGSLTLRAFPIVYTVTGTFGRIRNSGTDLLRLSGQPFRMSGTIDSRSLASQTHCGARCVYPGQRLELVIPGRHLHFALKDVPVTLESGAPGAIAIETKVLWVPFAAVVRATLNWTMPHALPTERIDPNGSSIVYGRGRNRTILDLESGTVSATTTAPLLAASPGSVSLTARRGRAAPSQTLHVSAPAPLALSIHVAPEWLIANPPQSKTDDPAGITVSIDPSKMPAGERVLSGRVIVTCLDAANSPLEIPVTVTRIQAKRRR